MYILSIYESIFTVMFQNSIRHNLSLHSKFMRVQNEGTGKSSWWMLNPDASKTGKLRWQMFPTPNSTLQFNSLLLLIALYQTTCHR